MKQIKYSISIILILVITFSFTSTNVFASSGWIPVKTIKNDFLGYRIDISPTHRGYTPDGRLNHINVVGYIYGR